MCASRPRTTHNLKTVDAPQNLFSLLPTLDHGVLYIGQLGQGSVGRLQEPPAEDWRVNGLIGL